MESDCSQFVSDLSTELSYPASDVPPIPSAVDQSEWRSALYARVTATVENAWKATGS
jgi:hypothetical protein